MPRAGAVDPLLARAVYDVDVARAMVEAVDTAVGAVSLVVTLGILLGILALALVYQLVKAWAEGGKRHEFLRSGAACGCEDAGMAPQEGGAGCEGIGAASGGEDIGAATGESGAASAEKSQKGGLT